MTGPQPTMSLDEFRRGSHSLTKARQEARRDYERYTEQEADAEREYRRTLATAFTEAKVNTSVAEAELIANERASEARHKRDIAKGLARSCLLRIEALEADRATLRTVAEWSQRIDGVTA